MPKKTPSSVIRASGGTGAPIGQAGGAARAPIGQVSGGPRASSGQAGTSARASIGQANAAIRRGKWAEAHALLERAARELPEDAEVQAAFLNVSQRLRDNAGTLAASRRLIALDPDDPDLTLSLAGAYLVNVYPMLALRTFREYLQRWPDDPRATAARAEMRALEARVDDLLGDLGLTGPEGIDIAAGHEESRLLLEAGQLPEARAAAERVLERRPDFVPTLNNLNQVLWLAGQRDRAIETAERVLTLEPENLHALSNLTRYLAFAGRIDEARRWADRLKAVESDRVDAGTKKAEALSYLGDDQGVLDAFEAAERAGHLTPPLGDPYLFHWAAVAAFRLGRPDDARRLWQRALKLSPNLEIVRDNQADLRKPVGRRHAPWAFSFAHWTAGTAVPALTHEIGAAVVRHDSDEAIDEVVKRHLIEHPETTTLVSLLLDQGDPPGRDFALLLATTARTPALLEALRDFALGQRGPDAMRQRALLALREEGFLPAGPTRLWMEGEWRDLLTFGFEIHTEQLRRHPPDVEELAGQAIEALRQRDGRAGERILLKALEMAPEAPDLLHNLANAYSLQGRDEEAEALIRRLFQEHPDYFFAQAGVARFLIRDGKLDEALAILDQLMTRERFHLSEFGLLANAQVDLAIARGETESADHWLKLWEDADPDHPAIPALRRRVGLLLSMRGPSRQRRR